MKLLIVTQKVDINDDVLGFMHSWIKEFASRCEKLTVICLYKGEYNLPANVKVLSLGKEKRVSKIKYIFRFYKYIWQERKNYDNVFIHMNHMYVILGGLLWRLLGKKVGLWYAHGYVPFSLRIADKFSNLIFTSTKSGYRINSKKVNVVGQGTDTDNFIAGNIEKEGFKIITIGRISPVKDYKTLIKAIEILKNKNINVSVDILGGAGLEEQEKYMQDMKELVKKLKLEKTINFLGSIPFKNIIPHLQSSSLFVNMSHTGSLDKVILEAMSCELPILTCNEALIGILGNYENSLMYEKKNYKELAKKIEEIFKKNIDGRKRIGKDLRNIVVQGHSVSSLISKILNEYKEKN